MDLKSNAQNANNEIFGVKQISAKFCESCIFCEVREPFGKLPRIGNCRMYQPPHSKPEAVLFGGEECEFYEKEKKRK